MVTVTIMNHRSTSCSRKSYPHSRLEEATARERASPCEKWLPRRRRFQIWWCFVPFLQRDERTWGGSWKVQSSC